MLYYIQVTGGFEDGADVGPMISVQAKERAEQLIQVQHYILYYTTIIFEQ